MNSNFEFLILAVRHLRHGRALAPTGRILPSRRVFAPDNVPLFPVFEHVVEPAFDVFAAEPPQDRELLALHNFLATPHIGGSAFEAILAMGRAAIDGLDNNDIPALPAFE